MTIYVIITSLSCDKILATRAHVKISKSSYCTAWNFWGRKLSQFCHNSRKFSPWNLGAWHPLVVQASNPWKFSLWKLFFHQFAKTFSLASFLLYGTCSEQLFSSHEMGLLFFGGYKLFFHLIYLSWIIKNEFFLFPVQGNIATDNCQWRRRVCVVRKRDAVFGPPPASYEPATTQPIALSVYRWPVSS